ncbi:unnamed protein product [Allacma fusca]|uniref:Glycine-rich protein n=1 Tax=Allacma fusca TaxID=39272 RepID=A0A8J2K344_9HEXA|nr:unnamed protein product [Allacma fusca]
MKSRICGTYVLLFALDLMAGALSIPVVASTTDPSVLSDLQSAGSIFLGDRHGYGGGLGGVGVPSWGFGNGLCGGGGGGYRHYMYPNSYTFGRGGYYK